MEIKLKTTYKNGESRVKRGFVILKKIGNTIKFFENTAWEEIYINREWISKKWITGKERKDIGFL